MFEVTVVIKGKLGEKRELTGDRLNVGRSKSWADLRIADPTVSRQHARLHRYSGSWVLEPMKSVKHNGVPASSPIVLADGDSITLTDDVVLQFAERSANAKTEAQLAAKRRRPGARVLADLVAEAEQDACGIAVLRRVEFPLLMTGTAVSLQRADSTTFYPLGGMVRARRDAGQREQLRLGRGEASDVLVTSDTSVSKRHALLIHDGGGRWSLASLGRAKTLLDGERLSTAGKFPLDGDVARIELGQGNLFTFFHEEGFRPLFRKLLASRLIARQAATMLELGPGPSEALSATGQQILSLAEELSDARSFLVALDNALLEEATSWRDLTDLLSELAEQVVEVTASLPGGEKRIIYTRG